MTAAPIDDTYLDEDRDDEDAPPSLLAKAYTASWLRTQEFPPLREFVPGLITEGLGGLVGGPKLGKSWFSLDISLACAYGGKALGKIDVEECDVLYLALEDGQRRMQDRITRLQGNTEEWPENLVLLHVISPNQVILTLHEWFKDHPKSLVILDTLSKNRRPSVGGNQYLEDYNFCTGLKNVVDAYPGSALLAVHHDRKQKGDDFVSNSSGTNGISGAMDYVLVLSRARQSDEGVLHVTGRDITEAEYGVQTTDGQWTLLGANLAEAAGNVPDDKTDPSNLSDRNQKAIAFVNGRTTTTPAELAKHLGIKDVLAGNVLARLEKKQHITKQGRGTYAPNTGGESGESGESAG